MATAATASGAATALGVARRAGSDESRHCSKPHDTRLTYQSPGISRTVSRLNAVDSQVRHAHEQSAKGVEQADAHIIREMVEEIEHALSEDSGRNSEDQRELLQRCGCDARERQKYASSEKQEKQYEPERPGLGKSQQVLIVNDPRTQRFAKIRQQRRPRTRSSRLRRFVIAAQSYSQNRMTLDNEDRLIYHCDPGIAGPVVGKNHSVDRGRKNNADPPHECYCQQREGHDVTLVNDPEPVT